MTGAATPAAGRRWGDLRHRLRRRIGSAAAVLAVSLAAVSIGVALGGHVDHAVGPFSARLSLSPSLHGGTDVQIPPLGSLELASHDGPAHLSVRLTSLDRGRALALTRPDGVQQASQGAVTDLRGGILELALRTAGVAVLAALLAGAVVFRSMRRTAACGVLAMVVVATTAAVAAGTFRPNSVEEPRYQGLLANAPSVIGDAHRIAGQYDAYRAELQRLITNVTRLYDAFSGLPVYQPDDQSTRVLHVSDLHLNPAAWSVIATVVQQFHIDVVIDTGDINDWGSPMETSFVDPIGSLGVPYVYIRGNHDSAATASAVAGQRGAIVLDNQVVTVTGLTIAGIGDPRFTPDRRTVEPAAAAPDSTVYSSGERLAATIATAPSPVDIALVHDPAAAAPLAGLVPLVLAGHLHQRKVSLLPGVPGGPVTRLMVEGSTGGAGLRGLQGDTPTPLEMTVLYFDASHALQAYDEITVGGTGQSTVTLDRHLVTPAAMPTPSPSGSGGR